MYLIRTAFGESIQVIIILQITVVRIHVLGSDVTGTYIKIQPVLSSGQDHYLSCCTLLKAVSLFELLYTVKSVSLFELLYTVKAVSLFELLYTVKAVSLFELLYTVKQYRYLSCYN